MCRYKGRASLKVIESKFPHHVDMMVPEGGFGSRLNAMHDWHDAHGIEAIRGQSRRENGCDIIRWCFADLVTAAVFAKEFGAIVATIRLNGNTHRTLSNYFLDFFASAKCSCSLKKCASILSAQHGVDYHAN